MKNIFSVTLTLLIISSASLLAQNQNLTNRILKKYTTNKNKNYVTIVDDDCSTLDSFITNRYSSWGVSSSQYVSPGESITDSPDHTLRSGTFSPLQLRQEIGLTNAKEAFVKFNTKWELQKFFSYMRFDVLPEGAPNYGGIVFNWIHEKIDLSQFDGQKIYLRFFRGSRKPSSSDRGFAFDDFKVKGERTVVRPIKSKSIENNLLSPTLSLKGYPNPASTYFIIESNIKKNFPITISTAQG